MRLAQVTFKISLRGCPIPNDTGGYGAAGGVAESGSVNRYATRLSISRWENWYGGMKLPGERAAGLAKCCATQVFVRRRATPFNGGPMVMPTPLIWWQAPQFFT